ncbi:MAG: 2',3'-cyclic-nucleotide 2'-phosphodiesterase (5'-nucleotidase family), partial [Roseivirga sp.]
MKRFNLFALGVILLISLSCSSEKSNDTVDFIILQINDVYEIAPLEGGKVGGMARVATLRKQLLAENPNVITTLSGDFVSPSLTGTLKYENEKIAGKQMIEVMNAVGIDYVVPGNHEFDLKENEIQQRIDESQFTWTTTNVRHVVNGESV